ncbi:MAG TPA: hypothetical protein VFS19_03390 [Planctomycetota bacterium]|nr:hypothetical protein [Planctomycetota bacterium]
MSRLPLWLKLGWTVWVALWAPAYALYFGPENFLWFCNLANFLLAAGLWLESPLLVSWQAVSVLLVQILYVVDVAARFFFGFFIHGGTKFMFDEAIPLEVRLLSLCMHAGTPPVLVFCLGRLGYDRSALPFQVATTAVAITVSFLGGPLRNINWSWGPLFKQQEVVAPVLYLPIAVVGYTILLYLPAHVFFVKVWPRRAPAVV